jgi:hypothetical protein
MGKKSHERASEQVQISISMPKSLLAQVDNLASADGRSRSNWIVRKLEAAIDEELRQKNIAILPAVADAEDPSSSKVAESPDAPGSHRLPKTRAAIRGMVAKENPRSKA